MINIETICFLLVVVGSLGMFYYLGFLAGHDEAIKNMLMWNDFEFEDEKENEQ